VLYLIFNEGYGASAGDRLIRRELCAEAIRLTRVLASLMPDEAEVLGLLALMLLHDARRESRTTAAGELVLLEEQDRSRWDAERISEGQATLDRAMRMRRVGPYQIQAAIAALHDAAPTAATTDWPQISALYRILGEMTPSPVVELNRAVAVAMADGPLAGLGLVDGLVAAGQLDHYPYLHAARADLLRRLDRRDEAVTAYRAALERTANEPERVFLEWRVAELGRALA
jgi:RNA polymerase sigma-70 factor, ECF subfamily